jgi:hypothetical protein
MEYHMNLVYLFLIRSFYFLTFLHFTFTMEGGVGVMGVT